MKNIKQYTEHLHESSDQDELNGRLLSALTSGGITLEHVKNLLDRGADVNAVDVHNRTPLHWAARHGLTDIARLLIDRGANVNAEDGEKETPLHWAARHGHTDVTRLLLDRGANVNAENGEKETPLHWAARNGQTEVARLLLDRGAQVDAEDVGKKTPLHWVARYGFTDIARLLIDRGADPTKAFDDLDSMIDFFDGNIGWMPEELKAKLERRVRSRGAFGRF